MMNPDPVRKAGPPRINISPSPLSPEGVLMSKNLVYSFRVIDIQYQI